MFSTKNCFENHNKNNRSSCSLKRCDEPILPKFSYACARAKHARYSSAKLYFAVAGSIVY